MKLSLKDEHDNDDPILSVVNLIDVFLVLIAALLLSVAADPLNPYSADKVTVIRNAGQPNMEIVTREGNKIERFRAEGAAGKGKGVKAGVAYRMSDGSLVYVAD